MPHRRSRRMRYAWLCRSFRIAKLCDLCSHSSSECRESRAPLCITQVAGCCTACQKAWLTCLKDLAAFCNTAALAAIQHDWMRRHGASMRHVQKQGW